MFAGEIQATSGGKLLNASDVLDFPLYPFFSGTYSTEIVNAPIAALGDRYGNLVFSGEVTCQSTEHISQVYARHACSFQRNSE